MTVTLPPKIINGSVSSLTIIDIMRPREPKYEYMFHEGQEALGHYYLAPFQRPACWTVEQSRRLIESVWLGIDIGSVVISAEGNFDRETEKFPRWADWIIDGQQRMRAIDSYLRCNMRVFVGTEYEHSFEELDRPQQRRFEGTPIGFVRLDETSEESLRELYNRLNFGGTAHREDQMA